MRHIRRTLLALLVTMATAMAVRAADSGSIRGSVVDNAGKGLRGAIVSAINEDEQKSISVLSDTQGNFILDRLPASIYVLRARLTGYEDTLADEVEIKAGDGSKTARFVMDPAKDLLAQRTGASLFGELKIDDKEQWMTFKMSCTYCHQVGTFGFRTPEQPVDWQVMITRMDGFGALHPDLKKTVVKKLVDTYSEDAPKKWAKWTPPRSPQGQGTGHAGRRMGHGQQAPDDDP